MPDMAPALENLDTAEEGEILEALPRSPGMIYIYIYLFYLSSLF